MKNRLGKLMEFNAQRLFMDQFFFLTYCCSVLNSFVYVMHIHCMIEWPRHSYQPEGNNQKANKQIECFFFAREHFSCRFYLFIVQSRQEMRNKWTIEAEGNTRCFFCWCCKWKIKRIDGLNEEYGKQVSGWLGCRLRNERTNDIDLSLTFDSEW